MMSSYPDEGTNRKDGGPRELQLAADLRAAKHELRRKDDELRSCEAARAAVEHTLQQVIAFLSVASHDLRTPLTAILGYIDLMDMGIPERLSDESRDRVQRIRLSAKHLLRQLNEMSEMVPRSGNHVIPRG